MSDLIDFLRARLDEDERKAIQVYRVDWNDRDGWAALHGLVREHAQHHDPARVLRDVEAKRRIVDEHGTGADPCDEHDAELRSIPCPTLEFLASIYSDHEEYREEWRP